jgi:hypothetical protein
MTVAPYQSHNAILSRDSHQPQPDEACDEQTGSNAERHCRNLQR